MQIKKKRRSIIDLEFYSISRYRSSGLWGVIPNKLTYQIAKIWLIKYRVCDKGSVTFNLYFHYTVYIHYTVYSIYCIFIILYILYVNFLTAVKKSLQGLEEEVWRFLRAASSLKSKPLNEQRIHNIFFQNTHFIFMWYILIHSFLNSAMH